MDHEKGNTLKVYIKQYLNRYKGCFALVAGIMIFYIFTLYLCGVSAADIRYFAGLEIVFLVVSAVFCGIRYWYRLRTVKRQIRDYMQGMQTLSDTEDALEEVYMDALEQLQNKRQEEKGAYRNQQREMEEYYALWVHQIKTPISAMRLLLDANRDEQTPLLRQELFKVDQYADLALKFVKLGDIQSDLVIERCDLNEIAHAAVKKYSLLFVYSKLSARVEPLSKDVPCDRMWLEFILCQLLSNSVKYTRSGGVRIYMEKGDLVVEDSGIGIRKEDLPRIFEKGYTGYNGRMDTRASGIGLYLVKRTADALGIRINVTSELSKGTRVLLHFPVYDEFAQM